MPSSWRGVEQESRRVVVDVSGATAAVVVVEGSLGENSQVCASISGRSSSFQGIKFIIRRGIQKKKKKKRKWGNIHPIDFYETHTYSIEERKSRTGVTVSNRCHTSQLKHCLTKAKFKLTLPCLN